MNERLEGTQTWIISRTEDGYRVYSPEDPVNSCIVSGSFESPLCTCSDFQGHEGDLRWQCDHIQTVLHQLGKKPRTNGDAVREVRAVQSGSQPQVGPAKEPTNGASHMLIRRSVSPDGRIDSLSVEFSRSLNGDSAQQVTSQAEGILRLQSEITRRFLAQNGKENSDRNHPDLSSNGPVPAEMLNVGGMDGKWGRRLFINVQVNGRVIKLFGTQQQLAEHVSAAGFAHLASKVEEGAEIRIPCRVLTKPSFDGRFLNVEQVLPPLPEGRRI